MSSTHCGSEGPDDIAPSAIDHGHVPLVVACTDGRRAVVQRIDLPRTQFSPVGRGVLLDAGAAAVSVGMKAPSQFSREYRPLFGAPPQRDAITWTIEAGQRRLILEGVGGCAMARRESGAALRFLI
jgi:hypothetical protein